MLERKSIQNITTDLEGPRLLEDDPAKAILAAASFILDFSMGLK